MIHNTVTHNERELMTNYSIKIRHLNQLKHPQNDKPVEYLVQLQTLLTPCYVHYIIINTIISMSFNRQYSSNTYSIGAGIIGLPSSLNKSGFLFGLFLMIIVALMVDYGVRQLIACGIKIRKTSYEETMQYVFGTKGFYIASVSLSGFAFGAMIVYHVIIGDTIPKIFQTLYPTSILCNRPLVVTLYSLLLMLPLSLLKNMASLDKTSSISFVSVIFIIITVTIEGSRVTPYDDLSGLNTKHLLINGQWFTGVGVMAAAFVCHHNSFIVYNSLEHNTQRRWNITTHCSLLISLLASTWLAVAGFICFQVETKGDILNNFSYNNTVINYTRAVLAATMVFTYPMELFVARYSLIQCLKLNKSINTQNENKWFYAITLCLWGMSLLIGAFITDVGIVLAIVGVVCGALIGFIYPGLIMLRVHGFHSLKDEMIEAYRGNKSFTEKYNAGWNFLFPIFMSSFGVVIMVMGIIEIFINAY